MLHVARADLVSTMAASPSPLSGHSRSILREEQNRSILDLLEAGASLFFFFSFLFFFRIINGTKQGPWPWEVGTWERNKNGTCCVGFGYADAVVSAGRCSKVSVAGAYTCTRRYGTVHCTVLRTTEDLYVPTPARLASRHAQRRTQST